MRSDVKLAFCLSGGVDSSGLAAIAKKKLNKNIKTYTIFFLMIKNIMNLIQSKKQ